jgi:CheY-like chemotaxis protein
MGSRPVILVADDDDNDVFFLGHAFETAGVDCHLEVARDGREAIAYLRGKGAYGDRGRHPWPALMLLDLKMPLVNGFEVLSWWQTQKKERDLPIVVLSASNLEEDIEKAMALGATAYQVKPYDFSHLLLLARGWGDRWLTRTVSQ